MKYLVQRRWFPIAVTFLAIVSVGAEVRAILRGLAGLVGR
jgi:hypothetical protein